MKKSVLILLSSLVALSACNEHQIAPLPTDGTVVASIKHSSGDRSWLEIFTYDDQGRIKSIEDQFSLGRLKSFNYEGDQLLETVTTRISDNRMIFRDSLAYDANGRLSKIYNFSVNQGEDLPLSSIETLSYGSEGQLIETSTDNLWSEDHNPRNVYHWEDGNVVKEDRYWDGDNLSVEYFMSYDDKVSVNTYGATPFQDLLTPTRNNMVEVEFKDYTGLIDAVCNPCTSTYTYANERPVAVVTNWNYAATITYKQIETGTEF